MKITSSTGARFKILVEESAEYGGEDGHPADIYVADYVQADDPAQDQVENWLPVATRPADETDPSWAPDGRVAFITDVDGGRRLRTARPGEPRSRLLVQDDDVEQAVISADGSRLAYVAGSPARLFVADADGQHRREVPLGEVRPSEIAISPDGRSIVVANGDYRNEGLFLVSAEGSKHKLGAAAVGAAFVRAPPAQERQHALEA